MLAARTTAGRAGVAAILADPGRALLAFDYDGTLAPIVADPRRAYPHPRVVPALVALSAQVGRVAVITGRPAAVAVELAGLADVSGLDGLVVVGHYGMERWDAASGRLQTTQPPAGLDRVRAVLPGMLASLGAGGADIEDKGLSVAVHVRRLDAREQVYASIAGPVAELAAEHGLTAEPGRYVVEVRPPGMDKGRALRALFEETASHSVGFAGDDLGDLAAFDEVVRLRTAGHPGLLVCSGSDEVEVLRQRADLVVDGPGGVAQWVEGLVDTLLTR